MDLRPSLTFFALGLLTSVATPADAALVASASVDSGAVVFAIDNDLTSTCGSPAVGPCQLPDQNPALGTLQLGAYNLGGDLDVQVVVNTADVATGPGTFNRLDSTGTQFTNNGTTAHTFQAAIGATDFAGPSVVAFTTGAGQWSHLGPGFGTGGDTSAIEMVWWNDAQNQQGALTPTQLQPGQLLDAFADVAGPTNPDSFSHNGGPFAVSDPDLFSMTLQFQGVIAPGVRLTGREMTEVKPQVVPMATPFTLIADLIRWIRGT